MKEFHDVRGWSPTENPVVFADVDCKGRPDAWPIHGHAQKPGHPDSSLWPTIRHFNKQTGYGGEGYKQQTKSELRDELGPKTDYLRKHILKMSGASGISTEEREELKVDAEKKRKEREEKKGKTTEEM